MLLVVGSAIQIIIFSLVSEQIGKAYLRMTVVGLFLISSLSGVGFLNKGYSGFAKAPETNFEWFATAYNAAAASGTAILLYLGVIMFICIVLQVSVIRAKIVSEKR